jgi:hypothetical protein
MYTFSLTCEAEAHVSNFYIFNAHSKVNTLRRMLNQNATVLNWKSRTEFHETIVALLM